jgi:trimeric autotransporter adhesin
MTTEWYRFFWNIYGFTGTGVIPVDKGGTGLDTIGDHQVIIGNANNVFEPAVFTGSGINITYAPGVINLAIGASGVTPGTYGSASQVGVFTVNQYGNITAASNASIGIDANQIISGTIASARISGSYTGITGVGTLTAGTWNADTIGTAYGGTGLTAFTSGGALYATSTSALTSGTLPITAGGTGQTSFTNGQLLIGNTTGNTLTKATLTAGSGVSITNGAGSITISATGSGGTVTSVSGTAPISVATGTTTPVISISQATTSTNGYLSSTDWNTFNNKQPAGSYLTAVSIVSANGFAGTSSGGTTPALTLSTAITGLLKGNGTAISAATSGTDYAPATSGTSILYGNGAGGFSNVTIGTGVSFVGGTLSATGSGGTVTSVTGTSPVVSSGGTTPAISLATAYGDTLNPYASKTANYFLAAPNGSAGVPTFRAIVAADIPALSYVTSVSGTGTVNGITLTGTVTSSGSLTLGGTLSGIGNSQLTNSTISGVALGGNLFNLTAGTGVSFSTGTTYNGSAAITINATGTGGTVTSVAALTLGTTGTDLSSTVANSTTTPVITLNVPTASATNRGALSSTDWSTFNGKQAALVSGTNIKTVGGVSLLGSGDVGTIGTAYGGTGLTSFTANGVVYASSTSVLATGSNLLFDGRTLAIGGAVIAGWGGAYGRAQIGTALSMYSNSASVAVYGANIYNAGAGVIRYINTSSASQYVQNAGGHIWSTASSGTAGDVVTFATQMTLDAASALSVSGTGKFGATVGVGGTTPSASGAGITFPATQSASTDVNTLDDYEEGTWTPNIAPNSGAITSYTSSGAYTKIGRLVTLNFTFTITNAGTGIGYIILSNLPFTTTANTAAGIAREVAVVGYSGVFSSFSSTQFIFLVYNNSVTIATNYQWVGTVSYYTA